MAVYLGLELLCDITRHIIAYELISASISHSARDISAKAYPYRQCVSMVSSFQKGKTFDISLPLHYRLLIYPIILLNYALAKFSIMASFQQIEY